jgi:hypothetical protein
MGEMGLDFDFGELRFLAIFQKFSLRSYTFCLSFRLINRREVLRFNCSFLTDAHINWLLTNTRFWPSVRVSVILCDIESVLRNFKPDSLIESSRNREFLVKYPKVLDGLLIP